MNQPPIARLLPNRPLPPYSFVPGHRPHPISDPLGHSHGQNLEPINTVDPTNWKNCIPYLWGIDLFNHGYYWEAHETWEQIWHACARKGQTADFIKGLIQLAVAGVKVRQQMTKGVATHAKRAVDLFQQVKEAKRHSQGRFMGLDLAQLTKAAHEIETSGLTLQASLDQPVEIVFTFMLRPQ